jgi:hypothetical protein
LLVLGGTQKESIAAKVVDLASDALGVVVGGSGEAVTEELALEASDAELVFDVSGGFFEIERLKVKANGDALLESFERCKAELVSEVRLTEEHQGDEGKGVHLIVEQKTELVKEFGREEMGLIDDEKDEAAFASQVVESRAELGQQTREAESGLSLEGEKNLAVEGGDA